MNRRALALAAAMAFGFTPFAAQAIRPVKPIAPAAPPDAGAPAEPAPVAPVEPAHRGPVHPVGEAPKPVPKKPQLPPELQVKPPPPPKKIVNPAEVTYRKKTEDHLFVLRVRPGEPKPGQTVELLLELSKLHDPPDPVVGDREPVAGAELVVSLEKGGAAPEHLLHALDQPGQYGAHITAGEAGLYTVRIASRSGDAALAASFPLGIGVPTPVRPDDVAATLAAASRGPHRAVRSRKQAAGDTVHAALPEIMRQLGEKLLALDAALSGQGDAAAQAHAMAELSKAIAGQTPPQNSERPAEFDQQAGELTHALGLLAQNPTRAKLADVEQNHCWKCHAEYRFGVASDVSGWPKFVAAEPQEEK